MATQQPGPLTDTDPLADFDGHVPDRSKLDAELRIVNKAEFLIRLEPRAVAPAARGVSADFSRSARPPAI